MDLIGQTSIVSDTGDRVGDISFTNKRVSCELVLLDKNQPGNPDTLPRIDTA